MVTIAKIDKSKVSFNSSLTLCELRGLSTDTKPTQIKTRVIDNGSVFIEIDTGKIYMFDSVSQEWKEI